MTATAATVNMAVANFIFGGRANTDDFDFKVQIFTRQRMVHIDIGIELSHFNNGPRLNPVFGVYINALAH